MAKTFVEKFLEYAKAQRQEFRNTVIDRIIHIKNIWDNPEDLPHAILANMKNAAQMVKDLTNEMKMYDALVGQYEILNDIRLGKIKLVDASTNKLLKVKFDTIDE